VRALIETAQRGMKPEDLIPAVPAQEPAKDGPKRQDLENLRAWFVEWSETARAAIRRRDYLIRLGLAKRQKRSKAGAPTDEGGDAPT
jgi:hypothetical protein